MAFFSHRKYKQLFKFFIFICIFYTLVSISYFCFLRITKKTTHANSVSFSYIKFEDLRWIFNGNIIQYSTLYSSQQDYILFETLIFSNSENINKFKCLILNASKIIVQKVYNISEKQFELDIGYVVRCKLKATKFSNAYPLYIAIVQDFNFTMSQKLVHFNRVFPVNKPEKSTPKIILCSGVVRFITRKLFQKIFGWISINKQLGYSKIRLSYLDFPNNYLKRINHTFGTFVEMIPYSCHLEKICSYLVGFNYSYCLEYYQDKFIKCTHGRTPHDDLILAHHQIMTYEDCLLRNKYEYEFMANFDVDELILPRGKDYKMLDSLESASLSSWNLSDIKEFVQTHVNNPIFTFNIVNYIEELLKGRDKNTAALRFWPVWILDDFQSLFDRVLAKNYNTTELRIPSSRIDLVYFQQIKFEYIKYLSLKRKINQITNNSYIFTWFKLISLRVKSGEKCIYVMKHTDTIAVHWPVKFRPGTTILEVPYSEGFLIHYRIYDNIQVGTSKWWIDTIKRWFIDKEYFWFIARMMFIKL